VARTWVLIALVAASSCGTTSLPPTLAGDLAVQADEIARLLEARDSCGAVTRIAALRTDVARAIADGEIDAGYVAPLEARLEPLDAVRCVPPTPKPVIIHRDDDDDDDKGRGKGKGRDKDDD
jgi:hypothetical protein